MRTKEIAEAVGKSERSVRYWLDKIVSRAADRAVEGHTEEIAVRIAAKYKTSSPELPADYDLDETIAIIEMGLGRNAAAVYRMNAERASGAPAAVMTAEEARAARLDRLEALLEGLAGTVTTIVKAFTYSAVSPRPSAAAALPQPVEMEPRAALRRIVDDWAREHGRDYHGAWSTLYREYGYRYHRDIARAAKNRGQAVIDYAEAENIVGELLALAYFLYGQKEAVSA